MRIWIGVALVAFPLLDLWSLVPIAHRIGWWLVPWLVMSALTGLALIREARFSLLRRVAAVLHDGDASLGAMMDSGRMLLAGLLFIFPGVVSDIAALLLLITMPVGQRPYAPGVGRVIDGDFLRQDRRR